jgi:hypothetical protein
MRTISPTDLSDRKGGINIRTFTNQMHPSDPKRVTYAEDAFRKQLAANKVGRAIAPLTQV